MFRKRVIEVNFPPILNKHTAIIVYFLKERDTGTVILTVPFVIHPQRYY